MTKSRMDKKAAKPTLHLTAPSSKSQTQRALLLAALASGESTVVGGLDCDDSRHLRAALSKLGAAIHETPSGWEIRGAPLRAPTEPLWCGDAGTVLRFLAPLALLLDDPMVLDGSPQLRARPNGELFRLLAQLGITIDFLGASDNLPVRLHRCGPAPREVSVHAAQSSQFASGLLMVGPRLASGLSLTLLEAPVSRPYLSLTIELMRACGVGVSQSGEHFTVAQQPYQPHNFTIEGDWSAGAFLLAGAWIADRDVKVDNLSGASTQGDRAIVGFLDELAKLRPHRFDLIDCPDLIAPLGAAAIFASHPVELVGLAHARLKESDRLAVLAHGLRSVGVKAEETPDALHLHPCGHLQQATVDVHSDHRMAMAFGLLSLRQPGIKVSDPGCVTKSYPRFWDDLATLRLEDNSDSTEDKLASGATSHA